jgi:hypothetical protein
MLIYDHKIELLTKIILWGRKINSIFYKLKMKRKRLQKIEY